MVTEPQVWTIIGVLAATLIGMVTLTLTWTNHTIVTAIGGLRGEIRGELGGLRAEMSARFETVNVRIDGLQAQLNGRIDTLDLDIQAVSNHVFGGPAS